MWFFFSPEVGVLVNRVIKFYGQGVVLSLADCYFEIRTPGIRGTPYSIIDNVDRT